jgi:glycosyltransferase involved in cell wall biosynthesis
MNVLWLASWYPNRTNITNGDFIERHAKAVAPFVDSLTVIAAVKDEALAYNAVEIEEQREGNICTYIIYYGRSKWSGAIERFFSLRKYLAVHDDIIEKIIREKGKPDLVHVQVAMKAGLVARRLQQQYNIPYIVTEHWTAYYKEARPAVYDMGNYFLREIRSVLKNAALLLPVSRELGDTISKNLVSVPFTVIPNVVDTNLFYPAERQEDDTIQLVHISNMTYQKNAEAIIQALAAWKQQGGQFVMQVFGQAPRNIIDLVHKNHLQNQVVFNGEVLQPVLSAAVRKADALVLYSRYETFGCVIIEANASGTPVILSDLPVFHELVTDKQNGLFVQPGDPVALAGKLALFAKEKNNFNREKIAARAKERYSYDAVGRQIRQVYERLAR